MMWRGLEHLAKHQLSFQNASQWPCNEAGCLQPSSVHPLLRLPVAESEKMQTSAIAVLILPEEPDPVPQCSLDCR
jgi:hypothetical protein